MCLGTRTETRSIFYGLKQSVGIKAALTGLRFEAPSGCLFPLPHPCEHCPHWAIPQKNWKKVSFQFASRTAKVKQNVCRDLRIASEPPSLLFLQLQMLFRNKHPPISVCSKHKEAWCLCQPAPGCPSCVWGCPPSLLCTRGGDAGPSSTTSG